MKKMSSHVKVIFFDLGGTLVTQNIENNLVTSRALKAISKILPKKVPAEVLSRIYRHGYEVNQAIRSRHHVEIPIETWMLRLLRKALGTEPSQELVGHAIQMVVSARAANAAAFPDSRKVVAALRANHVRLGALSNVSSHEVAVAILDKTRLRKDFDSIITSAGAGIRKPDPGIFRSATSEFRINPTEAAIVGDSEEHDIRGGYAVGWRTVLIDRKKEHYNSIADYRFESLQTALPTLQSL
jgi:HAD superfamily hydrolase (TIGR01509 family)